LVENAQHDPQEPWFSTGATAPEAYQLMAEAMLKLY